MSNQYRVGVIGSGAWGTALSILANRAGSSVVIGTRNANVIQSVIERRVNDIYLPGIFLDPKIAITDRVGEACRVDIMILAVPSHILRSVCIAVSDLLDTKVCIVIASKGIERGSLMLMNEVVQTLLPKNPVAVLSGPNFAEEAARGMPTATTFASTDAETLDMLTYAIGGRLFRPYLTDDVIGAQIGGAIKNVIAIACGIAAGKGMGENARAALVTRGFTEISRLAIAKGGRYETLMGLSGLGDLLLTCGSIRSRNMSFGVGLGQGRNKEDILANRGRTAVEGIIASESASRLARKFNIQMPICDAVYRIIYEGAPVDSVIEELLERPFVNESH